MDDVWAAAADVVAAVAARSPDPVELLAVTAQGDGCWLVDADARPVGPALLWNDNRAAGVVDGWARDGTLERAFAVSGCYGASGVAHAQLRWLARARARARRARARAAQLRQLGLRQPDRPAGARGDRRGQPVLRRDAPRRTPRSCPSCSAWPASRTCCPRR